MLSLFVVQNDPPTFLPVFLRIYHSCLVVGEGPNIVSPHCWTGNRTVIQTQYFAKGVTGTVSLPFFPFYSVLPFPVVSVFPFLGGRFGYSLFFSARGGGRGSPSRQKGGGVRFCIENPRRGVSQEGEGPRGREGVCGALGVLKGGGAKYFLFGAEMSTKFFS